MLLVDHALLLYLLHTCAMHDHMGLLSLLRLCDILSPCDMPGTLIQNMLHPTTALLSLSRHINRSYTQKLYNTAQRILAMTQLQRLPNNKYPASFT